MSEEVPSSATIRSRILRDVFSELDFEDAVALVGTLFEYRIVFSRQFSTLLREHTITVNIEAFEPQAAARFVADTFSHDCDRLFLEFRNRWAALRDGPQVRELISRIEAHQFVDHIEPWPSDG